MPARVQCADVRLKCASMDLLCSLHSYLPVGVSEVWKEYARFSVWTYSEVTLVPSGNRASKTPEQETGSYLLGYETDNHY